MAESSASTRFHRFAISTLCVAMVTLVFGALTTSKNAGMAFRDWPTSDGQAMLTYPWLSDFARNWDKFLEHGHRLAGMLIGVWSIALVSAAYSFNQSRPVKMLSVAILIGVICQGLLGGFRVQLDERGLAMLHGSFAAIVFSLMGAAIVITSPGWNSPETETSSGQMRMMKILAIAIVIILALQYLLGGLIRHRGTGLHEHLGLGILSLALIFFNFINCGGSSSRWLRRSAMILALIAFGQVVLGAGAWIFRFGFAPMGYVAVSDSIQQVTLRTVHTVWGIVTFQYAIVHLLRVLRVDHLSIFDREEPVVLRRQDQQLVTEGGPK
ncbi:COX15/CtaA family protein [Thalassoglobus sp. JC818]|uniref:COX15/CtaA family protein n=1 Tax=Thalassoglobus sp. JC818 TaxID=3232136 RepID=UPI0034582838